MIAFVITILRIMTHDAIQSYVHMRKKAHISVTMAIWAMEVLAVVSVHELLLHITIPTMVAAHEAMVIILAEE